MKRLIRIIILFTIIILAAYGWYAKDDSESSIQTYRTEMITQGDIKETVNAIGTLNPQQMLTVGSQVSGRVNALYAKVNERVKTDQLIAEIDPSLILAQLKQDKINLETARLSLEQVERDLNRTRTLVEKEYLAKVELERAEQSYRSAKNFYEAAKTTVERDELNLGYTKITAPIDGTIISVEVTEGQTLQASFQAPTLFKIAGDLTQMKIEVNFTEADISKIKPGMRAIFTVNAYPNRTFDSVVKSVSVSPSGQTQTAVLYSVLMSVINDDLALLPGMTANVSVILSEKKNVLRIPVSALRFNPPAKEVTFTDKLWHMVNGTTAAATTPVPHSNGGNIIYLLKDDVLVPVSVKTGASDDAYIEVSGEHIAEGDMVVTGIKKVRRH